MKFLLGSGGSHTKCDLNHAQWSQNEEIIHKFTML